TDLGLEPDVVLVVPFELGLVGNEKTSPFVGDREAHAMGGLVHVLARGENVPRGVAAAERAPVQRGFRSVAEMQVIADADHGPVRQLEAELEGDLAAAHVQVAVELGRLDAEGFVVASRVIMKAARLAVREARPAEVVALDARAEPVGLIARDRRPLELESRAGIEIVLERELRGPATPAFTHPFVLAESSCI